MKRLAALAAVVLALSGCEKRAAESATVAGPGSYVVEKLFTTDGCSVYRFRDYAERKYFTNCSGSTEWTERHGKSDVPTGVQGGRP